MRTTGCADACAHCAESVLRHLGKSSVGWKFLHRADPEWSRTCAYIKWHATLRWLRLYKIDIPDVNLFD